MSANVNKTILLGRVSRVLGSRPLEDGGRVTEFVFVQNARRKSPRTGQWEDDITEIDCVVFSKAHGRGLADFASRATPDDIVYVEGRLKQRRGDPARPPSHYLVVDEFEFLTNKDGDWSVGRATADARRGQ